MNGQTDKNAQQDSAAKRLECVPLPLAVDPSGNGVVATPSLI